MKGLVRGMLFLSCFLLSMCGLPSNPVTPPEVLVTGEVGTAGGVAIATRIPFSTNPSPVGTLSIPSGYSLWGSVEVDNDLVLLVTDTSGHGSFLVGQVPLSTSRAFVHVTGLSGTPYSLVTVTPQILAVLESTTGEPGGCIELFNAESFVNLTGGGSLTPKYSTCEALPSGTVSTLKGGFLLPMADGVMVLAGVVTAAGAGTTTTLYLLTQSSLLSGGPLSVLSTWTLNISYGAGTPLSGAALSEVVLLPDPSSPEVDLFSVTDLYGGGGGTLLPLSKTPLGLSTNPTLLGVDPSQNFLLAASSGSVTLFGLNSVLNPSGTVAPLGAISVGSGESFDAITTYTGSS